MKTNTQCSKRAFLWATILVFFRLTHASLGGQEEGHALAPDTAVSHPNTVINATCPVNPDEKIDPDVHANYEGRTIYFCCNRCRKKFLANPIAYLAALPRSTAAAAADPIRPHDESADEHPGHAESTDEGEGHDHSHHHAEESGGKKVIDYVGKFHPLVVHFPIALILSALLAEIVGRWRGNVRYAGAARFTLFLGAISAVVAATLGWLDAAGSSHPADLARILLYHRIAGVSVAISAVAAAVLAHVRTKRPALGTAYAIALGLSALLVGLAAHLGATLIYGADYFSW